MRFVYHTGEILSVMTKQYVCIFLVWVTSGGREDSVFHANSLPQCLFFPRFQTLVLFNRGGGGGETSHRCTFSSKREKDQTRK